MNTDGKNLEDEISRIKNKLLSCEDTDFTFMDPQIRELRHSIMYVHTSLEAYLDIRIGHILLEFTNNKIGESDRTDFYSKLSKVLDELDFAKKIKICQEFGLPKNIVSKLFTLNDIRVKFSHPSTYQPERIYRSRESYFDALKKAEDALDSINNLIKFENPNIKSAS